MSKAYTKFTVLKERLKNFFTWNKNTLTIPASTLAEFPSQEDCDDFIKKQLVFHGFDVDGKITTHKREDGAMIFEQSVFSLKSRD